MPVDLGVELRLSFLRAAQAAQEEMDSDIQDYRDFWNGDQAIQPTLTDRQKTYLTDGVQTFGNICKRVVSIPKDRLEITEDGIAPVDNTSAAYADKATDWWRANGLVAKQKDIYEASLRDGSVGVIVEWDTRNNRPKFTPNMLYDGETGLIRFHYDDNDELIFASKRWSVINPIEPGATGKRRTTIYRPDSIWRYVFDSTRDSQERLMTPQELGGTPNPQPWTDTGNFSGEPLGIPVVPFENPGGSELDGVLVIQELLNHSLITFDRAVDMHGFPLLWLRGFEPETDSTGRKVVADFGPGQGIVLRDDGAAGRIEAADLAKMFQYGPMSWVQLLALLKGWPFFLFDKTQTPPSGVALQILEGSLVKQVTDKQAVFTDSWRQCFDMGRKLNRLMTKEELPGELDFNWESAKTNDEKARMETFKLKFEAGDIPQIQRWRELGYSEDDIAQMLADREEEDKTALEERRLGIEMQQIALERERATMSAGEGAVENDRP